MKGLLRTGLALMLAITLLTLGTGYALATDRLVDEKAEIDLMVPKMHVDTGATGDAELILRIDADGMLKLFRATADAEGLIPGYTYSFWVGHTFIASGMADDNGSISFDATLDSFGYDTLLGLKVKIVQGIDPMGMKVLVGKVMELDESVLDK
ncbi:MAG: hypothetical protein HY665_09405 [Chloroflexi bacterium]|nr:hypothetical protein [Chloroflexota bacterium]